MEHRVEEFSCDGKKVAVLGEIHYKDRHAELLCNKIKSKYKIIGVEGCPPSSFLDELFDYIYDFMILRHPENRPSSIQDVDLIISHFNELNKLDEAYKIFPDSVIKTSLAKNIKCVHLEKYTRPDPYYSMEIQMLSIILSLLTFLVWSISLFHFFVSLLSQGDFHYEYLFLRNCTLL